MNTQLLPGRHEQSEAGTADQVETTTPPIFPNHRTQAARLLADLILNQRINPLVGWFKHGIYRLSDTKFRLKEMGWPVITGTLEVKNRFGEICRVAEYRLEPEAIETAGQEAQAFAQRERELREVA